MLTRRKGKQAPQDNKMEQFYSYDINKTNKPIDELSLPEFLLSAKPTFIIMLDELLYKDDKCNEWGP